MGDIMVSLFESGMASLLDHCLLFALNTKPTEVKERREFIWLDFFYSVHFSGFM